MFNSLNNQSQRKAKIALSCFVSLMLGACSQATLEKYEASGVVDSGVLVNNYRTLVLPTMQKNCSGCHATGKAMASIPHSDPDAIVAWQAELDNSLWNFDEPELSKVIKKLRGGHNCWGDCNQNADYMVGQVQLFKTAVGSATDGISAGDDANMVYTGEVVIPATLDVPKQGAPDTFDPQDLIFPLDKLSGIAGSQLIIKIYRGNNAADYSNYYISNLRIVTSKPLYLHKIVLRINGVQDPSNNTFDSVEANVVSATGNGMQIDNGFMSVLKQKGPGLDSISIGFGTIGKGTIPAPAPTPTPGGGTTTPAPTLAEILAILKLPAHKCMDCHANDFLSATSTASDNAFKSAKGMANFIMAPGSAANSLLYKKTKDQSMPKAGSGGTVLTPAEVTKIQDYINSLSP